MPQIIRRGQLLVDHLGLDSGKEGRERDPGASEHHLEGGDRGHGAPSLYGRHERARKGRAEGGLGQAPPLPLVAQLSAQRASPLRRGRGRSAAAAWAMLTNI
jgi:hypothetical protein